MNIVVLTCDKYAATLRGFVYLFRKYWHYDQRVTVAGFTPPDDALPANFRFHSIGAQADYPVEKWSDGLIDLLEQRPDLDTFVLLLEDYWLTRPVNVDAVRKLYDFMRQFRYVLKLDLCADRLYAQGVTDYDTCGYLDLVKSDKGSPYHFSLMPGIWNRELLLRFLVRNETPWQCELNGTPRLAKAGDDVLVLGTRQWPLRVILANRGGDPNTLLWDGVARDDRQQIERLLAGEMAVSA